MLGRQTVWFLLAFFLTLGIGGVSIAAPANDDFSAATVLTSATGTSTGTTVDATAEPSEPGHYFYAHHSIWYQWTAPSADPIDFNTLGSDFDTVLAVYTGSSVDALTPVAQNDNDPLGFNNSSRVSFTPVSGTTYYIAIDGNTFVAGTDVPFIVFLSGNTFLIWGPPPPMNTISGTVSLPAGKVAPAGGMDVNVNVSNQNGAGDSYVSVNIAEGATSATYSMTVPVIADAQWRVSYSYGGGEAYWNNGYYNSTATTWDYQQATLLAGGSDHASIDMTLLTVNTISGTVSLPAGKVAPIGGMDVSVSLAGPVWGYDSVNIAEGASSGTYSMTVPAIADAQWSVSYSYGGDEAYVSGGYYNSTATTWDYQQATLLAGGSDHTGINLTLLTGNTISGTVTLPAPAPTGGMYVYVEARNQDDSAQDNASVNIAEGATSGAYSLTVPIIADDKWKVSYYCGGVKAYVSRGYYNSTATTWRDDQATPLAGGNNHPGINLTLITTKTISGTVSMPSGVAPVGGTSLDIYSFYNQQGNACSPNSVSIYSGGFVTIVEGESSATYTLQVPADNTSAWGVVYYPYSYGYVSNGYYNSAATTWDAGQATLLVGVTDHAAINLTLLTGRTISGKVLLPASAPAGGMWVEVLASNENNGSYSAYDEVFIAEGATSSETYTLHVPPDPAAKWGVSYWGDEMAYALFYVKQGYYNSTATTWDPAQATLLPGGAIDYADKNMTLITGKTISGTITTSAALIGDFSYEYVYVSAVNLNRSGMEYKRYAGIGYGSSSGSYTIVVPDVTTAQWQVSTFSLYDGWRPRPHYYYNGTPTSTWDSALATPLSGGADHSSINMMLPLTYKTISGKVYLPAGKVAPIDLMSADVFAVSSTGSQVGESYLYFYDGANYATYSMTVPDVAGAQWLVKYENYQDTCDGDDSKSKTISEGYYNTTATVGKSQATPLSGSTDHDNINMTMFKTMLFNWNLFLPAITCPKK
jgi:hypothetical protein